jgi:hypothetical protein
VRLKHKTFPSIFVIHFSHRRKRQRIEGSLSFFIEKGMSYCFASVPTAAAAHKPQHNEIMDMINMVKCKECMFRGICHQVKDGQIQCAMFAAGNDPTQKEYVTAQDFQDPRQRNCMECED